MSPEARARRAERFKRDRIWLLARNTGPKTPEGRAAQVEAVTIRNTKHGARAAGMAAAGAWLASLRQLIQRLHASER